MQTDLPLAIIGHASSVGLGMSVGIGLSDTLLAVYLGGLHFQFWRHLALVPFEFECTYRIVLPYKCKK